MAKRRKPKRLPTFLTDLEVRSFLAAALDEVDAAKTPGKKRSTLRDAVAAYTAIHVGMRLAELCALTADQVDLETGLLRINLGKGGKDRVIPIADDLLPLLATWLGDRRDGYLFPGPSGGRLAPRTVQLKVKALGLKAGIPKNLTPHKLRHTFATALCSKGVPMREIAELLGHASISTTQVYTHTIPEHLRAAVNRK